MESLTDDTQHWQNLIPPLAPNEHEVAMYRHHSRGHRPICLLGMTKNLIPMCDYMVDLSPIPQERPVIKCDWNELEENASVVLGDGVLNLCGVELAHKMLNIAEKVIFRVFLKKFEGMKYAQFFPREFVDADLVIPTQKDVVMVVWSR